MMGQEIRDKSLNAGLRKLALFPAGCARASSACWITHDFSAFRLLPPRVLKRLRWSHTHLYVLGYGYRCSCRQAFTCIARGHTHLKCSRGA